MTPASMCVNILIHTLSNTSRNLMRSIACKYTQSQSMTCHANSQLNTMDLAQFSTKSLKVCSNLRSKFEKSTEHGTAHFFLCLLFFSLSCSSWTQNSSLFSPRTGNILFFPISLVNPHFFLEHVCHASKAFKALT